MPVTHPIVKTQRPPRLMHSVAQSLQLFCSQAFSVSSSSRTKRGCSLSWSPGEASLTPNTSNMPGRHFFRSSKSLALLQIGNTLAFTLGWDRKTHFGKSEILLIFSPPLNSLEQNWRVRSEEIRNGNYNEYVCLFVPLLPQTILPCLHLSSSSPLTNIHKPEDKSLTYEYRIYFICKAFSSQSCCVCVFFYFRLGFII